MPDGDQKCAACSDGRFCFDHDERVAEAIAYLVTKGVRPDRYAALWAQYYGARERCWLCENSVDLVWWAPQPLWDQVHDGYCVLCMACFTQLAWDRGLGVAWMPVLHFEFDDRVEADTIASVKTWGSLTPERQAEIEAQVEEHRPSWAVQTGGPT